MTAARSIALWAALGALAPGTLRAQAPDEAGRNGSAASAPRIQALPAPAGAIAVDGRLNEALWAAAQPGTGFTQTAPEPGSRASEATEVRVLFDDEALYVGVRARDARPDSISAPLGRRDATLASSDWISILLDSYHDRLTGTRFSVNPRGVRRDALLFEDNGEDTGWDGVWDVATTTDSAGWTAEFRIPLSQLRFRPGEQEQTWGMNVTREIARRGEVAHWSPVPPSGQRLVSLAGELTGLRGLRRPRHVEVMPYLVSRVTRAPGTNADPFYSANDLIGSAGADLRYGLSSSVTLAATVNPDFGQVEADPAQVNLSGFETFLPEKRPFFTEGTDLFRMPIGLSRGGSEGLFYSRRIGRAPQRTVSETGGFVEAPQAVRILEAAKLSGKVGGWSIGALQAVTAGESVQVADSAGILRNESVEAPASYAVVRASRDFNRGGSSAGAMVTATNRSIGDPDLEFLRSDAYTGGMDFRHRFQRRYEVSGWLLGSHLSGSAQSIAAVQSSSVHLFQRPDAEHVEYDPGRTSLSGWAGMLSLARISGEHWTWGMLATARSPGFEVNDLGYQGAADVALTVGNLRYARHRPEGPFRRWGVTLAPYSQWSFGGEHTQLGTTVSGDFQLRNFWLGALVIDRQQQALSATELRGGPAALLPGRTRFTLSLSSDRRRPLVMELGADYLREDGTGGNVVEIRPGMAWRPSGRLEMIVSPRMQWNHDALQYVGTVRSEGATRYLFSRLDQRTASLVTRVNYTVSPTLSLQLYAQPFVSAADFSGWRLAGRTRAAEFDDRFPTADGVTYDAASKRYSVDAAGNGTEAFGFRDPDFNLKQFRSNLVVRWEYRPGSTLYVGWSQGRDERLADGTYRLSRDLDRLAGAQPTNVLMVKLSYWLDL